MDDFVIEREFVSQWERLSGDERRQIVAEANAANINEADDGGLTRLHVCAAAKDFAGCVTLLAIEGIKVDATDDAGYTPLTTAAWKGSAQICELLLDSGASVDGAEQSRLRSQSKLAVSPLSMAISFSRRSAAEVLLKRGASLEKAGYSSGSSKLPAWIHKLDPNLKGKPAKRKKQRN